MNSAHLHVAMNHFPVVGVIIGTIILICGLVRLNQSVQRTALWTFIGVAAIGIATLLTGEGAEQIVRELPRVDHDDIEAHEKMAKITFWTLAVLATLSAIQIFLMRNQRGKGMVILIAIIAVAGSGLAGYTASLGGKITHNEFEQSAPAGDDDSGHKQKGKYKD